MQLNKLSTNIQGSVIGVLFVLCYGVYYHMNWRLNLPVPRDLESKASFRAISTPESTAQNEENPRKKRALIAATIMGGIRSEESYPKSIRWDSIRADEKPDVVCVQYRSHHGFFLKEVRTSRLAYLIDDLSGSTTPASWEQYCSAILIDITANAEFLHLKSLPKKNRFRF